MRVKRPLVHHRALKPLPQMINNLFAPSSGHHVYLTDLEERTALPESAQTPLANTNEDYICMKVVKPVNVAEEIFNTYGELGNAKLLCSYGFTQVDNPADSVTIGLPALRAAAALRGICGSQIASRLAWCEASGVCDYDSTFNLQVHSVPSDELLLVLWILATNNELFDTVCKATKPKDIGTSSTTQAEMMAHVACATDKQGGLKAESALQILSEALRRRRVMYTGAPLLKECDSAELRAWKSNISILLNSEQEILSSCDKYLEEHLRRSDGNGGKKRRGSSDDSEQKEKAPKDAFSLFD
mmetsp:Transcript_354/g.800  ORF Transcript_354/g.800 Transcript_354/m.800 type:complete len:300 (-) Transcript_354:1445-2344(-)